MTNLAVSWPMYAADEEAVNAFWADLRTAMLAAGLVGVPNELFQPIDLFSHWCDPALLLSQTCGYPLVTRLAGRVRYVATPRFRVPGCEGALYRSAIVVRRDELANSISDLAGRRVAFNSRDSHSGYNALRFAVAPHAQPGRFFSAAVATGAHRGSLAAVRDGRADLAAVDPVTLAHLASLYPKETEGLRVLEYTPAAPGLPLITGRDTADETVFALRKALAEACNPRHSAAARLKLDGVAILDEKAYERIRDMQNRAVGLGYPELS